MLHLTETISDQSFTVTFKGLQFAKLSLGFDYRLSPSFAVGPLLDLSLGQYSSGSVDSGSQSASQDLPNKSLHEWLTIGVRGVFDVIR
jgi:hypothetical protein